MSTELKPYDDTVEPDQDSYETPPKLLKHLAQIYHLNFQLDAAATFENTKCSTFLSEALHFSWNHNIGDVWCNPPHSLTEEFVRRADAQHKEHNINICMIVPANCQSTVFWEEIIEDELTVKVENHPIKSRPRFLKNGKKTKFGSRNAYRVIIWRQALH